MVQGRDERIGARGEQRTVPRENPIISASRRARSDLKPNQALPLTAGSGERVSPHDPAPPPRVGRRSAHGLLAVRLFAFLLRCERRSPPRQQFIPAILPSSLISSGLRLSFFSCHVRPHDTNMAADAKEPSPRLPLDPALSIIRCLRIYIAS